MKHISLLRGALITWYAKNKRSLPWRKTKDPYSIWLSEVMLQQTTVETVVPYYHRFLKKFPTIESLSLASDDAVLKEWSGLGYYARVRNFKRAAKIVIKDFGGVVPTNQEDLKKLPGLGDYTSAAVASIAFGKPCAVVDGNVLRVLSRFFCYGENITSQNAKKFIREKANELLDPQNPGDFNQALMEIGATICASTKPKCLVCPLAKWCRAHLLGEVSLYPYKAKKNHTVKENSVSFFFYNKKRVLVRRRHSDEMMPGMWEFPQVLCPKSPPKGLKHLNKIIKENKWPIPNELIPLKVIRHAIMNKRMMVYPYFAPINTANPVVEEKFKWISRRHLDRLPLTTISKKTLDLINLYSYIGHYSISTFSGYNCAR